MQFGGVLKPPQIPTPFVGAPQGRRLRVEVVNTGHMTVWIGDISMEQAKRVSINTNLLHPQVPQQGRALYADDTFFCVLNSGEKLYVARVLDTLHVGAITVLDWGAEITWFLVDEPARQ